MAVGNNSKIGIVGLGLIGGSLAITLSQNHYIVGKDTNAESIDFCLKKGYINSVANDFSAFIGCEVIFVCVPVWQVKQVCDDIFAAIGNGGIITDVASVKGILSSCSGRIVGGHPMAGTEYSGVMAAKPELFCGAPYYLVKYNNTFSDDYLIVKNIISNELRAKVVEESCENHDRIVGLTSHLPHMIAYSLASVACGEGSVNAGNSLKDTTRIAASDPKFWANVARLNKDNIIKDLDLFMQELTRVKTFIAQDDFVKLENFLSDAQSKKLNN